MKKLIIAVFCLFQFSCKQKAETCDCPEIDIVMESTPFEKCNFSNGKSVAITSPPHSTILKRAFSAFGIYECGADSLIRYYGDLELCLIDFSDDTVFISRQEILALGENFGWVDTTWLIDKYYYDNGKLKTHKALPSYLGYDNAQIDEVLRKFESTEWKTQMTIGSDSAMDKMMQLANNLMIASISGNDAATKYFRQFNKKFEPDGHYQEWYNEMQRMIDTARIVTKRNNSNQE
jgi:hypothetical protein